MFQSGAAAGALSGVEPTGQLLTASIARPLVTLRDACTTLFGRAGNRFTAPEDDLTYGGL
jgi:hypothetical protein